MTPNWSYMFEPPDHEPIILQLSDQQIPWASDAGVRRRKASIAAGLTDMRVNTKLHPLIGECCGIAGEMAACLALGLDPNDHVVVENPSDHDLTTSCGWRADVKNYPTHSAFMVASQFTKTNGKEIFVLTTGWVPAVSDLKLKGWPKGVNWHGPNDKRAGPVGEFKLWGWVFAKELIRPENYKVHPLILPVPAYCMPLSSLYDPRLLLHSHIMDVLQGLMQETNGKNAGKSQLFSPRIDLTEPKNGKQPVAVFGQTLPPKRRKRKRK